MIPQPTLVEQRALIDSLAPQRLRRFRAAVAGDRGAIALYLLDSQIASHLHATVRMVEVALRERVHRALSSSFDDHWYLSQRELFDVDLTEKIDEALEKVGEKAPPGKVVAQLMLGTWVSLLGKGDRKEDGTKARFDRNIWAPALQDAFPGIDRKSLHRSAMSLNWARNRINHCEPIVFGFPQPGLGAPGVQLRRAPHLVLEDARSFIGYLDADLEGWMRRWSEIDTLLMDPLVETALDHIEQEKSVELQR
ncbi:Abi family protein [Microbacterium maritypicum]|uniref:Abi family protein n=1 Tax=Microbacterium maritypicum TaxID=33918 RepID=A0ACD4B4I7_MICMQ|nr:Abi family protein [Microbacterium liquefaciens]UTT52426.1 Abi family protein [Microbacterium liquefaciens]